MSGDSRERVQVCLEAVDDDKKDWRRLKKISECYSETTGLNGLCVCLSKQPSRLSPTSKCTREDIKDILMTLFIYLFIEKIAGFQGNFPVTPHV